MMQTYLINALIFCGILLLLVLTVGALQITLLLIDVRKTTREVKEKVQALLSILDIFTLLFGGLRSVKNKLGSKVATDGSTIIGFAAGLKRAFQVLFKK